MLQDGCFPYFTAKQQRHQHHLPSEFSLGNPSFTRGDTEGKFGSSALQCWEEGSISDLPSMCCFIQNRHGSVVLGAGWAQVTVHLLQTPSSGVARAMSPSHVPSKELGCCPHPEPRLWPRELHQSRTWGKRPHMAKGAGTALPGKATAGAAC